eukprot:scaffold171900_cov56-Cyclotella_meneghiniana.AAC.1
MLEQLWLCPSYGPVTHILGLKSGEVIIISGVCPHSRSKECPWIPLQSRISNLNLLWLCQYGPVTHILGLKSEEVIIVEFAPTQGQKSVRGYPCSQGYPISTM